MSEHPHHHRQIHADQTSLETGFSGLDSVTGGLFSSESYLAYGPTGAGKTTFALGFLTEGARSGETVAMVTRRPPATVLRHAESMGHDLEPYCRSGSMILLEYPEQIYENSARVLTDDRIIDEFRRAVGGDVQRVVLDPVTPLLTNQNGFQAARARTIAEAFSDLGATTLLLVDTPEGDDCLEACRNAVHGVLKFENSPAINVPHALIVEQFPHMDGRRAQLYFDIAPGLGMVEQQGRLLPAASEPAGQRNTPQTIGAGSRELTSLGASNAVLGRGDVADARILVIHPDSKARSSVTSLLRDQYRLLEASGVADGFARVGSEMPDLIVLGAETRGVSASEFSRKLRQSGWNMPVLVIGERMSRRADRIRALEAGADVCLSLPLDGRLLLTQARALLRRRGLARLESIPLVDPRQSLAPSWEDDGIRCTEDVGHFKRRVSMALDFRNRCGSPFTVVFLNPPNGGDDLMELASFAAVTARDTDLILLGSTGIAVLLNECESIDPYFNRLKTRWPAGCSPAVECPAIDESTTADTLVRLADAAIGGVENMAEAVAAGR